jgi:hypothetical protein
MTNFNNQQPHNKTKNIAIKHLLNIKLFALGTTLANIKYQRKQKSDNDEDKTNITSWLKG